MTTPFLRERPWNFAHVCVQCTHAKPFTSVFLWGGGLEVWDPLRPKYLKNTKTQISGEKTKKQKQPIRKRLGRGTQNTCAKIQGLSLKNGVDFELWRNLGLYAWSSLYHFLAIVFVTENHCMRLMGLPSQPKNYTTHPFAASFSFAIVHYKML